MTFYPLCVQNKDESTDFTFPVVKDQSQFMVSHAKSSKVFRFFCYRLPKLHYFGEERCF
jgi:hypothetical protein